MSDVNSKMLPYRNGQGIKRLAAASPVWPSAPRRNGAGRTHTLITGGAGFIGTNLAERLLSDGKPVLIYDNLSRPGVRQNLEWLRRRHGHLVRVEQADVRDLNSLRRAVRGASQVFHFAAQVAVTSSLEEPILDFEINARGTLNLLEALRALDAPPPLLFTSTNKVYGDLGQIKLRTSAGRYEPEDAGVRAHGFSEAQSLHFHSPYGCSKGTACQYVLDYARTFGLRTVVFRMSCIYGLHQFGNEDQGWVAHFMIRALENEPITIYGDGRQVRDVLFIDDLVNAFLLAQENIDELSGQAFNMGGGARNTLSLIELIDLIAELRGARPEVRFANWRPADQRYYVSDTRKFSGITRWAPSVSVREGVARLHRWLAEFRRSAPLRADADHVTGRNGTAVRLSINGNGAARSKLLRSKPLPQTIHGTIKRTGRKLAHAL